MNSLYKCELIHGPPAPQNGWDSPDEVELATLGWVNVGKPQMEHN